VELDLKAHLKGMAERMKGLLISDVRAIPADKHTACPGGCAKSPLYMIAECATVNMMVAHYLKTGERLPRPSADERDALLKSYTDTEKTLAFLEESVVKYREAVDGFDAARFAEHNNEFFGRPMTNFGIAELVGVHMMYHDGQLNYIQMLLGDSNIHWG